MRVEITRNPDRRWWQFWKPRHVRSYWSPCLVRELPEGWSDGRLPEGVRFYEIEKVDRPACFDGMNITSTSGKP